MSASVDLLATAAAMIAVLFTGMRLFYGAWPWEANKTWYHTRRAVEYVAALQRANRPQAPRQVARTGETSNDSFAGNLPPLRLVADEGSGDSFDRSLIAHESSPPDGAMPPKVLPTAEQPTPLPLTSSVRM